MTANPTMVSATILGLYASGLSAGALTALWPPFLEVHAALTGQDFIQARRFVASVGLIFGVIAVVLFGVALGAAS